jgi:FG-GAP repeat
VFAPDGRRILTASRDGTARLWGLDGELLATLQGHTGPRTCIAMRSHALPPHRGRRHQPGRSSRARVLWRDSIGGIVIWFMNGLQGLSSVGFGTVSPDWTIVSTGDFNGDGKGDILWRDNSPFANLGMWLMNGAQVLQIGGVASVAPTWTVRRFIGSTRRRWRAVFPGW